jgi:hypothetical protein
VDYIYYILAILVVGLACTTAIRFITRSRNPDLMLHYQARKKAARQMAEDQSGLEDELIKEVAAKPIHSPGHGYRKTHNRTPWGWPGADRGNQGLTQSVRSFTDRLIQGKQLTQTTSGFNHGSIRALLEDRYGPVDRGMKEMPYQKVKRPLLRDPSEMHDQLDNFGGAESRQLRKKLEFLSAMNRDEDDLVLEDDSKKSGFRYVELKDLKQPWGW